MMRYLVFFAASLLLSGCLMTRAQVKEQESRRETQNQALAMQQAHYDELETRLREANGRIETLEHNIEVLKREKGEVQKAGENERKELEAKLKVYEEALSKMEQQYLALSQKLEAMQQANVAPAAGKKTGKKDTFEQGEEEFKKKNYRQAITNYQNYRENFPKGKNYAEATYKMGVSFQEMGMKDDALPFFNEVIEKFPKSKSAEKAKIRLKQLK